MSVFGKLAGQAGVHFYALVGARSLTLCLCCVPLLVKKRVNPFEINDACVVGCTGGCTVLGQYA